MNEQQMISISSLRVEKKQNERDFFSLRTERIASKIQLNDNKQQWRRTKKERKSEQASKHASQRPWFQSS